MLPNLIYHHKLWFGKNLNLSVFSHVFWTSQSLSTSTWYWKPSCKILYWAIVPVLKENELLNHVCIMGEKIGSFPSSCPYGYLSGYIGPVIHSVRLSVWLSSYLVLPSLTLLGYPMVVFSANLFGHFFSWVYIISIISFPLLLLLLFIGTLNVCTTSFWSLRLLTLI